MAEDIQAEHERLLQRNRELAKEHRRLESEPGDIEAHESHRERLRQQIAGLRAHLRRLRGEPPDPAA